MRASSWTMPLQTPVSVMSPGIRSASSSHHLKAAIKKRTWLEIRRACRVSLVSFEEAANDQTMAPQIERALASAPRTGCHPVMLHAMTATVCEQLGPLVSRDVEAA